MMMMMMLLLSSWSHFNAAQPPHTELSSNQDQELTDQYLS